MRKWILKCNGYGWAEEGVLLFCPFESRTEGRRRQESDESTIKAIRKPIDPAVVRGSCRLPRFMVTSGAGKIDRVSDWTSCWARRPALAITKHSQSTYA